MVEEIEEEEEAIEVEMKEGDGESQVEDKKEKKKKIKKTNLEFSTARLLDWAQDEINAFNEKEVAMANNDRIVKETSDMRNELESYIYDMRDKVAMDSQLGKYGSEAEKSTFLAKNEAMENWLYEDGFDATKSVYFDKLTELKKLGGPMQMRQIEAHARPSAIKSLQTTVETFKNWVLQESSTNPIYSHITDDERQQCISKCDEVSSWMYDMLDKQGNMPPHADPVVTVAEINAKNSEVTTVCRPIRNKKAPPPPKKDEPKKEDPPKQNGGETDKSKTADGSTPMEGVTNNDGTSATPMDGVEIEETGAKVQMET